MTKSEFSASSVVALSMFVIYFLNGAQFLNATFIKGAAVTVHRLLLK